MRLLTNSELRFTSRAILRRLEARMLNLLSDEPVEPIRREVATTNLRRIRRALQCHAFPKPSPF